MNKAIEKAYEAYPLNKENHLNLGWNAKRVGFQQGYEQAEKDLIDKAVEWIKEINTHHHIMRYSDCCEPPISELIEWFKNYMKEGGEDE